MKLRLDWSRPVPLKNAKREQNLIYASDATKLPQGPGVYVFGRRFGSGFEGLYVGKGGNIRGRAWGQRNNLALMLHLQKAKNGRRIILAGRFISTPGQQEDKCLGLLERALIRYFLSEGVNKQECGCEGTKSHLRGPRSSSLT